MYPARRAGRGTCSYAGPRTMPRRRRGLAYSPTRDRDPFPRTSDPPARAGAGSEQRADWLARAVGFAIRLLALLSTLVAIVAAAPSNARAVGDCSPAADWPASDADLRRTRRRARERASRPARARRSAGVRLSGELRRLEGTAHGALRLHAAQRPGSAGRSQRGSAARGVRVHERGVGREHRVRLSHFGGCDGRLARLVRASRQHREPRLHGDRRRRRGSFRRHRCTGPRTSAPVADRASRLPAPSPPPAPSPSPARASCRPGSTPGPSPGPSPPADAPVEEPAPPRLGRPSCGPARSRSARVACKRRRHEPRRRRLGPTRRSLPVAPDRLDRDLRSGARLDRHARG